MAIKDWKIDEQLPNEFTAWRNKSRNSGIIVSRENRKWTVLITNTENDKYLTKDFKTEQKAIKYAKHYMKRFNMVYTNKVEYSKALR